MPQQQNKILAFIQETKWIFLAFFLFGAFHTVIESFLNTILINPILSKFEDNWIVRIGLIVIILYSLIKIILSFKNKKHISFKHLSCLILPTIIYIYYRGYGHLWNFIPLEHTYNFQKIGNTSIAYLDIIISCLFIPSLLVIFITHIPSFIIKIIKSVIEKLISYIKQSTHKIIEFIKQYIQDSTEDSLLYSDEPISEIEEDILDRSIAALSIAQLLNNKMQSKNTNFTFAVSSKWGNGKTSFINLILKQLDIINKNKYEPFEFQAWKISSSEDITSIFFKELAKKMKPYHSNVTEDIVNYGQTLTNNSNSSAISLIHNICSLSSNKTIEEKFNGINKQLEKINKIFIIIIDDLDRLDGNEIFSLLKIIRNSAYFNNVLFISAFDEDYVIKALHKIKLPKPEQYIEKIFESKYSLITPDKQTITNFLRDKMISIIKKISNISQDIKDIQKFNIEDINEISNIRDVKLLLNIFAFSYQNFQGNIYIIDLLYICILKYKYQVAYFYIANNIETFVLNQSKRILYTKEESDLNIELKYRHHPKKDINESINKKFPENSNAILNIIYNLFNQEHTHPFSFITTPELNNYFDRNSNSKYIKYTNIESLFKQDIYSILSYIRKTQATQRTSILRYIENIIKNNNSNTFNNEIIEKYIYCIFEICQTASIFVHPFKVLDIIINKYLDSSKSTFDSIIKEKIYSKNICRYFSYAFTKTSINIFSRQEALDISYSFFKTELEAENLHNIYFYFLEIKAFDYDNKQTPLIINDIKNLIISKPEKMLPTFINGIQDSKNVISYSLNTFNRTLWNNISDLEKSFTNNKSPLVREFLKFVELWENTEGYTKYEEKYIDLPNDFSFKYIAVPHENIYNF